MSLTPEEETILNTYKQELLNDGKIDGPDCFWPDQKITYEKNGRKVNAQIDAIYQYQNKHYFVELYVTLAHDPIDITDDGDMKIKADACKLVALYMDKNYFADKWEYEKGKILLLHSTYRSYKNSNRNSVVYLDSLGIDLDYTLNMDIPVQLIAKKPPKSSNKDTRHKQQTRKEILEILEELQENDKNIKDKGSEK